MARYSANLDDQYGRPYGALVVVSVSGQPTTLATLAADDGSALSNPLPVGSDGAIIFNADPNFYDLAYIIGGRRVGRDLSVNVGAVSGLPSGSVSNLISNVPGVANSGSVLASLLSSDPRFYGYIGDGQSHPLSGVTSFNGQNVTGYPLAAWQTLVPQVTALTNEIDGVAIQAMINAAGSGRCCIDLPAGSTALLSFAIQSGAGDVFLNIDGANIQLAAGLALGWAHGTDAVTALGRFYGRGRGKWLAGTAGTGMAYRTRFAPTAPQDYTTSVHDWVLRNFGAPAAQCVDAPRGIDYKNVQPFGPDGTVQAGAGLAFEGHNSNPGGFSLILDNCEGTNYAIAYEIDTYAPGALEGVQLIHSRGYTGQTLLKAYNHAFTSANGYYQAPILYITECDWQGTGPFLDVYGYTNVRSTNNYLVFEPNPLIAAANPLYGYDIKACHDVISSDDNINVLAGVRYLSIWHTDAQTRNTLIERPTLNMQTTGDGSDHTYAPTIVQFDNNAAYPFSNIERDMVVEQAPPGVVYVNDVGGNQVSTTRARVAAPESVYPTGTVTTDDYGQITYDDTFTGTTTTGGNIAVTCPPTLFRSAKTWVATNGNAVQTTAAVSSRPGNNLGFTATFAGLGAGVPVTVNYRMTGK